MEKDSVTSCCCCCCCCCRHIINHPGLSTQYLLLSQSLRTNPTLDSADFRGHRLTYLKKVYQNNMDPKGQQGDKIQETKNNQTILIVEPSAPLYTLCEAKENKTRHKNLKLGTRASPASRYKGAGRRPEGRTGVRASKNKCRCFIGGFMCFGQCMRL